MRRSKKPMVFGIGFHKTGTTSLRQALEVLGYRVRGATGHKDPKFAERVLDIAWRTIDGGRYDAFQDNPWPLLYREIDGRYPGSKFVLTVRDEDRWIASQVRHFADRPTPMREWIYGVGYPLGNESVYLERYRRHNDEVRAYFADRPGDMVEMDFARGDEWPALCGLLDIPVPNQPWPHANAAADRERSEQGLPGIWNRVRSTLRRN